MRKYLELMLVIIQLSAVLILFSLSLFGIYFDRVSSYGIALLVIASPPIASRYICNKPLIGEVESKILCYVLEQQENSKKVEKGQLHTMWENAIGIKMTRDIMQNLRRLRLIKIEKIREENVSFSVVLPTWRTKLLLDS